MLPCGVIPVLALLFLISSGKEQQSPNTNKVGLLLFDGMPNAIIASVVMPTLLMTTLTSLPFFSSPAAAADPLHFFSSQISRTTTSQSTTENYLPRRLYPGTYGSYCGPTPETTVRGGCTAHGWYGDEAQDQVDQACQHHDISYCNCQTKLLSRRNANPTDTGMEREIPLLSSLVALRFAYITNPTVAQVLTAKKFKLIDTEYLNCIHKADSQIITEGIHIRGEQQRTNCATDPFLEWFCTPTRPSTTAGSMRSTRSSRLTTLDAFEKINLNIFLRDLDADDKKAILADGRGTATLRELEKHRRLDFLNEIKNGKTISDAASSVLVKQDEEQILRKLSSAIGE